MINKALATILGTPTDTALPHVFAVLGRFSCIPCADKSHTVSSEVRIQIRCLFKLFPAHLTGQRALFLHALSYGGLRRGRSWCRTVQRTLLTVVPAVTRGGSWVHAWGLLLLSDGISHFVGDEAMARQGGGGCEAGAALQTLLTAALRPCSPVLADMLQEQCLVLCGEAAGGAAETRLRSGVGGRRRGGGLQPLHWAHSICGLFVLLHLRSSSSPPASPQTAVLF